VLVPRLGSVVVAHVLSPSSLASVDQTLSQPDDQNPCQHVNWL
jgi:hypothetical protein